MGSSVEKLKTHSAMGDPLWVQARAHMAAPSWVHLV